jgi:hypothetical protein
VDVPSKRIPFFKPSKELRDLVNGSEKVEEPAALPVADGGGSHG